ncbi:glutaredoxin family protein [Mesobacillus harenae]|uniref:glutaredoxin family protein n=1 Tax=Mesobacillus harenae TaxID=2213203 RepID=UPI0015804F25
MENRVKLYTRKQCPLCDKAKNVLIELQHDWEFVLEEVDIAAEDRLTELYGLMIPVVELNGDELQYGQINKNYLSEAFTSKKVKYKS